MTKIDALKALMFDAFTMAEYANRYSHDDPKAGTKEDKLTALSYAAACTAKYSAAEAIYWCSPELEDEDIPALLAKFDTFTNEIRNDYRDDHSRQWVEIEFSKLANLYANFENTMKQR